MKQCRGQMSMFSAEASHDRVNRSVKQGSEDRRKMTVTSGLKCLESYERSDQLGCLVRMLLGSSIWHSTRCCLTWKQKVTPAKRLLFQLAVSMHHTGEKESLFWPTPSTGAALCAGTGNFKTLKKMAEKGLITEEERKQLSQGNGGKTNPELLEWLMGYEAKFSELIPTPSQTDYKGGITNRWYPVNGCKTVTIRGGVQDKCLPRTSPRVSGMHSAWEDWPDEPRVDRVVNGIPNRVDRIKCLGNAVVPQQFYPFFAAIVAIEEGDNNSII